MPPQQSGEARPRVAVHDARHYQSCRATCSASRKVGMSVGSQARGAELRCSSEVRSLLQKESVAAIFRRPLPTARYTQRPLRTPQTPCEATNPPSLFPGGWPYLAVPKPLWQPPRIESRRMTRRSAPGSLSCSLASRLGWASDKAAVLRAAEFRTRIARTRASASHLVCVYA